MTARKLPPLLAPVKPDGATAAAQEFVKNGSKKKGQGPKRTVGIRLPDEMAYQLEVRSAKERRSMSELVEELLRNYFEKTQRAE